MKLTKSLRNINWKLFFALLVMGLCPAVWTTVRTFFIGQLPGEWSYSIAGQLSWVNLLYEIVNEAIILPLFFFVGKVVDDKKEFTNRLKTGLILSLGIYTVFSAIVMIFAEPLLSAMATDAAIIKESATYIRIESVANIFGILFSFVCVALVSLGRDKLVYLLTVAKLALCLVCDKGQPVKAAGTVKLDSKGTIRRITNLSGHYQPSVKETIKYINQMNDKGLVQTILGLTFMNLTRQNQDMFLRQEWFIPDHFSL